MAVILHEAFKAKQFASVAPEVNIIFCALAPIIDAIFFLEFSIIDLAFLPDR